MTAPLFTFYPAIGVAIALIFWFARGDSDADVVMPLFMVLLAIFWPVILILMIGAGALEIFKAWRARR